MSIFGLDELTVALLITFAFFILAAYAILRLVVKVAVIAMLSMAFPVALAYLGLYDSLGINNILVFGIMGPFLYITYYLVNKLLGAVWPLFGIISKKEKPEKSRKNKKSEKKTRKEVDEVEIAEQ
ncbi:MAG: hypothetical protein HYS53_02320 [Candidatus Aenigmarchaeota archaeon]|nr:hypothetical protein [Candidatus Aenigmarchaeota archaeon]